MCKQGINRKWSVSNKFPAILHKKLKGVCRNLIFGLTQIGSRKYLSAYDVSTNIHVILALVRGVPMSAAPHLVGRYPSLKSMEKNQYVYLIRVTDFRNLAMFDVTVRESSHSKNILAETEYLNGTIGHANCILPMGKEHQEMLRGKRMRSKKSPRGK